MSERAKRVVAYGVDRFLTQHDPRKAREAERLSAIRMAVSSFGADRIPIDLCELAARLGIREVRSVPLTLRGRLVQETGGLAVEISDSLTEPEARFVLAHEIAHVILDPQALGSSRTVRDYNELEACCDEAAKEILLPKEAVRIALEETGPSLEILVKLAERARTTLEVVASQVARCSEWHSMLLWWRAVGGRWVLVKTVPPKPESELVWWDIAAPSGSIAEQAASQGQIVHGSILIEVSGVRHLYKHAEVSRVGSTEIALLIVFP